MRDSDVRALKEKSHDINQLRQEVERLAGEVEVLRGVVEEGLKERREVREQSIERSRSMDHSRAGFIHDEAQQEHSVIVPPPQIGRSDEESDQEAESLAGRSTPSPTPSPPRRRARLSDHTHRTDQATLGSPPVPLSTTTHPFTHPAEVTRMSDEISDHRFEDSAAVSVHSVMDPSQAILRRGRERGYHTDSNGSEEDGPSTSTRGATRPTSRASNASDHGAVRRPAAPAPPSSYPPERQPASRPRSTERQGKKPTAGPSRPAAPANAEAPFPQIRGEYLEQLFFSAPDHNADTCTVCNRRARARQGGKRTSRGTSRRRGSDIEAEDEGFAEGDAEDVRRGQKGKDRQRYAERFAEENPDRERLPPQTVLSGVLKELEDDFTHYKGYVRRISCAPMASVNWHCAASTSNWPTNTRKSTPFRM